MLITGYIRNKLLNNCLSLLMGIFFMLASYPLFAQDAQLPALEEQYQYTAFLKEFRCVTCPNQNIMDSSAPVAQAMKEEIARRWQQGESPETIRQFLLAQYGDYVLYRPLMKKDTLLLWLGPFVMLFTGFFIWLKVFRPMHGNVQ